jgi:uncharacterized membrane protein YcaP (DUF421 family)
MDMELIHEIFGSGKDLSISQMTCRGVLVFFIMLFMLRLSGRRSFGLGTPLDNIITISLGAILSRAIVGVSPFLPVVVTCFVIVILHRVIGYITAHNRKIHSFIDGNKILVYERKNVIRKNMDRVLINEEDLMRGIRKAASTEDMNKIDKVYMEANGELSVIKTEE